MSLKKEDVEKRWISAGDLVEERSRKASKKVMRIAWEIHRKSIEKREVKSMKNHEKNFVENGNGKGSKTFGITRQNGMRKLARNALHPAQHSLQHINKKLLRSQIRERCLRQRIRRESVWWEGAFKGKCVEIKEHVPLTHHSPSGASGPGANFGSHFGIYFPMFLSIDFALIFHWRFIGFRYPWILQKVIFTLDV